MSLRSVVGGTLLGMTVVDPVTKALKKTAKETLQAVGLLHKPRRRRHHRRRR